MVSISAFGRRLSWSIYKGIIREFLWRDGGDSGKCGHFSPHALPYHSSVILKLQRCVWFTIHIRTTEMPHTDWSSFAFHSSAATTTTTTTTTDDVHNNNNNNYNNMDCGVLSVSVHLSEVI